MNVVAIVQARVGSSRLPAKVLLDLGGATALQRCLDRVRTFEGVREVIVATTSNPEDDLLVAVCDRIGVRCTRGSADDVLARYYDAATCSRADVIVRCTSDCPLLDHEESSHVVRVFMDSQSTTTPIDYATNCIERRLPRGLDTEVMSMRALERAHREARSGQEREHVTPYLYTHPELFRIQSVQPHIADDCSAHRWTLDTLDDYRLLATIYNILGRRASTASLQDILDIFRDTPSLRFINAHVEQKRILE